MDETGGLRFEDMLVAVESYTYRLRMAIAHLDSIRGTLAWSTQVEYVRSLLVDMLEAGEDATTALRNEIRKAEEKAGLGSDQRDRDGHV